MVAGDYIGPYVAHAQLVNWNILYLSQVYLFSL